LATRSRAATTRNAAVATETHKQHVDGADDGLDVAAHVPDPGDAVEPAHRADDALELLRVLQLDPQRLRHVLGGQDAFLPSNFSGRRAP
jgi:hypothetical protein